MEKGKTIREFDVLKFTDQYGESCSIEKSSLATEDAIWLGIDNPNPQIKAVDAIRLGIKTEKTVGWIPYEITKEVFISTRMHLTKQIAAELIPILQHFVKTGNLHL